MAIRIACDPETEGAVLQKSESYAYQFSNRETVSHLLYIKTFAVGCVLALREKNGRDDSDFYAYFWNETTQSVEQYQYATTCCPTYHNGATIDATPEVRVKAEAWKQSEIRRNAARKKKQLRKDLIERAPKSQVRNYLPLLKLYKAIGNDKEHFVGCLKLLKTKTFRNPFRESLNKQLREWLASKDNKYPVPFSPRQRDYLRAEVTYPWKDSFMVELILAEKLAF